MHRHAWRVTSRVDLFAGVFGVVGVAVDVDADSGRLGDVDGFGGSLLGTQPASEDSAIPGCSRPGDDTRWHVRREDRVDPDDPAPGVRLERGYAGNGWRPIALSCVTKRIRNSLVRG